MSVEIKHKKVRVLSAKITHTHTDRPRPFSGIASQTYTRKQLIQNAYVGQTTQPARIVSARSHQNKYVSAGIQEQKLHYRPANRQTRQKQQMAEQISALKLTINRLVEQLSHQRAKMQNMRKKNTKFQKILTLQFQDDKQWTSNKVSNHLVSGIKTMYETMKEKYELKCKEYTALITKIEATNILEYQMYIKTLEEINNDLSFKLQAYESQTNTMPMPSQTQKHASEFIIAELSINKEKLTAKLKQSEVKLKNANQSNRQMTMKIDFLQKLIIQKDNNIYALQRKTKKTLSDLQRLKVENESINKQLNQLRQHYQNQKQFYKKSISELQNNHKHAFETLKSQKDYKIGILQTNNAYVQQMLTQIRKTNSQLNRQLQEAKYLNSKSIKNEKQEYRQGINKNQLIKMKQDLQKKEVQNVTELKGQRIAQKADKKYRQSAVKKRKIQLNEVLEIAEIIKYKLIIQRISIDKLKKMFDYNKQLSDGRDQHWEQKYITMREVIDILKSRQLNLKDQDAVLLARYLIEDVQAQYVYCDELNQNYREVVKSILRTIIQQYPLYEGQQIDKKVEVILKNYSQRLKQVFKVVSLNGQITRNKFYDILTTLGIQTSSEVKEYLIAKMALNSSGINCLTCSHIFD